MTGNLKLVHEMYGPKNPLIPHEAFKREFADAIASNEEIDKHFNKARTPCASAWSAGTDTVSFTGSCGQAECFLRGFGFVTAAPGALLGMHWVNVGTSARQRWPAAAARRWRTI